MDGMLSLGQGVFCILPSVGAREGFEQEVERGFERSDLAGGSDGRVGRESERLDQLGNGHRSPRQGVPRPSCCGTRGGERGEA